jgi:hypothetical protein
MAMSIPRRSSLYTYTSIHNTTPKHSTINTNISPEEEKLGRNLMNIVRDSKHRISMPLLYVRMDTKYLDILYISYIGEQQMMYTICYVYTMHECVYIIPLV